MKKFYQHGFLVLSAFLMLLCTMAKAQTQGHTVSGTVTDTTSGNTLPGVNIKVKGKTVGTTTDKNGQYSLTLANAQDTLVFSFVGYKTKFIPIRGRSNVDVTMKTTVLASKEVTVVGYGEQNTETLTSSVSSVSGEEIENVPTSSLGNALFGKTTGIQLIQTSGQPGQTDPNIFIRGINSLNADRSHPIFILDGTKVRNARAIFQLDPSVIKSVSVLKDAAALSIYGIEGANGAIVVKTKRGEKGPIQISAHTSAGFRTPTVYQNYANSFQEATAYNEAQKTDGTPENNVRFSQEALDAFRMHSNPLIYPDVDWRRYLVKNKSFQSRTNITLSGGTDDVRFFVSGAYLKQDGFFKTFDSDFDFNPTYDRFNFQSNLDIDVTPTTQLSVTASGRVGSRIDIRSNGALWQQIYHSAPYAGPGIVDGKLVASSDFYIPGPKHYGLERYYGHGYNKTSKTNLKLHLSGRQRLPWIAKGLSLRIKGAYNVHYTQYKYRTSSVAHYEPYFKTDAPNVGPGATGDSTVVYRKFGTDDILHTDVDHGKDREWFLQASLHYDHSFGPHNIKGQLRYNQRQDYYPGSYRGIPRNLVSTVARVSYNYDRRYLLQVSGSYNGSEKFAEGKRFGFFPAVSGGWIPTNEPYFPEISFLTSLKFYGSYGLVGNDSFNGRFLYLAGNYNENANGYNFGNNVPQNKPGAAEGSLGNPDVTWSTSRKQNYGVKLHLFKNKLFIKGEYFKNVRSDILTQHNTTPSFVAQTLPAGNIGKVQNKGYEAQVTWSQTLGDFSYSVGGNVTFARNKILYQDEVKRNEPYLRRTGEPVGQPFGYVTKGFYTQDIIDQIGNGEPKPNFTPKPGFLRYKDLNDDGKINTDDQKPIGYPEASPEYVFGSNWSFKYKNIDLNMTWAAATHVSEELTLAPYRIPFGAVGDRTIMQWMYDGRWTKDKVESGAPITYPRMSRNAAGIRNKHDADFWLPDASYIRLKSLEVGYSFPKQILDDLSIKRLKVYLSGYNLLTFSKMMDKLSIDPEQPGQAFPSQYPVMKTYNLGVRVHF